VEQALTYAMFDQKRTVTPKMVPLCQVPRRPTEEGKGKKEIQTTGEIRILITLLNEMRRRQLRYGMLAICGGGMGVSGIIERV